MTIKEEPPASSALASEPSPSPTSLAPSSPRGVHRLSDGDFALLCSLDQKPQVAKALQQSKAALAAAGDAAAASEVECTAHDESMGGRTTTQHDGPLAHEMDRAGRRPSVSGGAERGGARRSSTTQALLADPRRLQRSLTRSQPVVQGASSASSVELRVGLRQEGDGPPRADPLAFVQRMRELRVGGQQQRHGAGRPGATKYASDATVARRLHSRVAMHLLRG